MDASRTARLRNGAIPVAAVLAALALASPASAKVWFADMSGRHLRTGQHVATVIAGCPGNPSCREAVEGARVYLRRVGHRGRRVRLGRVSANGRLKFVVPRVAPGRYRLLARVRTGRGWRTLHASDLLRIAAARR
jgi:hypothetical protein